MFFYGLLQRTAISRTNKTCLQQVMIVKNKQISKSLQKANFFLLINTQKTLITNVMSIQLQVKQFQQNFKAFIKSYSCKQHNEETPYFVCIDSSCSQRGMVCSMCIALKGLHKNHDIMKILPFMEHCLKAFGGDHQKNLNNELMEKINQSQEELFSILKIFLQSFSGIIEDYINRKRQLHAQKLSALFVQNILQQVKICKFDSFEQMDDAIGVLIRRLGSNLQINEEIRETVLQKPQFYLEDLKYQTATIGKELKSIECKLKQFLEVKNSSPVVLVNRPTFNNPKVIEQEKIIYIGETSLGKPHGRGICYSKNTHKILNGNFQNGQLIGQGEMYFKNGSSYIGEFRSNIKEGRGVYNQVGKEATVYEGQFKDGRRNGRGTCWWQDDSYYEGEFKNGYRSGWGISYKSDGQCEYEGYWQNGKFDGEGIHYRDDDQRYKGSFKQNQYDGQGTLYKKKSTVEGVWRNSRLQNIN